MKILVPYATSSTRPFYMLTCFEEAVDLGSLSSSLSSSSSSSLHCTRHCHYYLQRHLKNRPLSYYLDFGASSSSSFVVAATSPCAVASSSFVVVASLPYGVTSLSFGVASSCSFEAASLSPLEKAYASQDEADKKAAAVDVVVRALATHPPVLAAAAAHSATARC